MDKKTIQNIFTQPFELDSWYNLLQKVFGVRHLLATPKQITLSGNQTQKAFELGSFATSDDRIVGLYHVIVSDDVMLHKNKVTLRETLRNIYKYDVDGALVVFQQGDIWRLSFVSEIKVLNEHGEVVEQATEPKRFTYLLGVDQKVKTPSDRLSKLIGKPIAIKDILDAFSVEALNNEFYQIIAKFFYQLVGAKIKKGKTVIKQENLLQLPQISIKENPKIYQEFGVRLLGRMIFCWFLKMKKSESKLPLLPEELLSSDAVKNNENYYHTILAPLFFDTLNKKKGDRSSNLKHADSVPYLNGGLFEPLRNQDFYKPKNPSKPTNASIHVQIPNSWFYNLFLELEKFNFTIDENSIDDLEVSVDPEMLGRIFENLLAEIDPDSGDTARKATGSFYTPREIVDYMAIESITQFIHNKSEIERERLRPLFKISESDISSIITEREKTQIIEILDTIKILDPACGSGAFPMGVLQKIVFLLEKIDPEAIRWKKMQLKRVTNATLKRKLREKLGKATSEYARKLGIIQNSLYGVDIQPIATEITKLRCFLSLVVDEKIDDHAENRGIEPLPNLEFKFITANTLIKLPEVDAQKKIENDDDRLLELEELREEYFQMSGQKKELTKNNFKEILRQIQYSQAGLFPDTSNRTKKIASWNPFSNDKADWFDSKWMFGFDKFDIVIGNPPYRILTKNNTDNQTLKYYIDEYLSIKKATSKNLFIPFIQRGVDLLEDNGVESFIVPEGLFKTRSYNECVKYIKENGSVSHIITFSDFVFENAITGSLVYLFNKSKEIDLTKLHFSKNYSISIKEDLKGEILSKINNINSTPLKKYCHLFKGMVISDRKNVIGDDASWGNDKLLLGKNITKWGVKSYYYTDYSKIKIIGGTKKKEKHDINPRILIRRTGRSLCCALLSEKALTESTLYSCWPKDLDLEIKYIYSILNSKLLNYYNQNLNITNEQAFPQILMNDLGELPVITPTGIIQKIFSHLVDYINIINRSDIIFKTYEEIIDAMVMELYFSEDFKQANLEFIKYAEKYIIPINEMDTNEEKMNTINNVFNILQERDNEIRINLRLLDLKLPHIVRPIKNI